MAVADVNDDRLGSQRVAKQRNLGSLICAVYDLGQRPKGGDMTGHCQAVSFDLYRVAAGSLD